MLTHKRKRTLICVCATPDPSVGIKTVAVQVDAHLMPARSSDISSVVTCSIALCAGRACSASGRAS